MESTLKNIDSKDSAIAFLRGQNPNEVIDLATSFGPGAIKHVPHVMTKLGKLATPQTIEKQLKVLGVWDELLRLTNIALDKTSKKALEGHGKLLSKGKIDLSANPDSFISKRGFQEANKTLAVRKVSQAKQGDIHYLRDLVNKVADQQADRIKLPRGDRPHSSLTKHSLEKYKHSTERLEPFVDLITRLEEVFK